jgi:hypothetical protein
VAKRQPPAVLLPSTYAALLHMLQPAGAGVRRNPQLACLAAVVLGHGLTDVDEWPLELALAYLEDAFGARVWVEQEACRPFVANLLTALPEDVSLRAKAAAAAGATPMDTDGGEPTDPATDGDAGAAVAAGKVASKPGGLTQTITAGNGPPASVVTAAAVAAARPRFAGAECKEAVRDRCVFLLRAFMNTPAAKENPRVALRLLALGAAYPQGRQIAASVLGTHLNSNQNFRSAKALLDKVVEHTATVADEDLAAVELLLKMHLKPMHAQLYSDMIVRLVGARVEYCSIVLRHFLHQVSPTVSLSLYLSLCLSHWASLCLSHWASTVSLTVSLPLSPTVSPTTVSHRVSPPPHPGRGVQEPHAPARHPHRRGGDGTRRGRGCGGGAGVASAGAGGGRRDKTPRAWPPCVCVRERERAWARSLVVHSHGRVSSWFIHMGVCPRTTFIWACVLVVDSHGRVSSWLIHMGVCPRG